MHCDLVRDTWDRLHNIYEGDDKVKKEELQPHRE